MTILMAFLLTLFVVWILDIYLSVTGVGAGGDSSWNMTFYSLLKDHPGCCAERIGGEGLEWGPVVKGVGGWDCPAEGKPGADLGCSCGGESAALADDSDVGGKKKGNWERL